MNNTSRNYWLGLLLVFYLVVVLMTRIILLFLPDVIDDVDATDIVSLFLADFLLCCASENGFLSGDEQPLA
jgi:hypothetical protein